jgi:hypothetical protein
MYRNKQKGGQSYNTSTNPSQQISSIALSSTYITSTLPNSAFSTPNISRSSIQYVQSTAHLSSFGDIANLSIDQISSAIAAIDKQILYDQNQILSNKTSIMNVTNAINTPGGLQDQYNLAKANYDSTLASYNLISAQLSTDQGLLSSMLLDSSTLSISSQRLQSSVNGYASTYSSLLLKLGSSNELLAKYEADFQAELALYNQYSTAYAAVQVDIGNMVSNLEYNSSILSTAQAAYTSTDAAYQTVNADYMNYSTYIYPSSVNAANKSLANFSSLTLQEIAQKSTTVGLSTALQFAEIGVQMALATQNYNAVLSNEISTISTMDSYNQQLLQVLTQLSASPNDPNLLNQKLALQTLVNDLSTQVQSTQQGLLTISSQQSTFQTADYLARLAIADKKIEDARVKYVQAQMYEASVVSTMNGLSTSVSVKQYNNMRVHSSIDGWTAILTNEKIQFNSLSSQAALYKYSANLLSSQLISTLSAINTYLGLSSVYSMNVKTYQSSYFYYSTLESSAASSIAGWSTQRAYYMNDLRIAQGLSTTQAATTAQDFVTLDTNAQQFFQYKQTEIISESQEYQYAVLQYNSAVGLAIANLLLLKGTNYTNLDKIYLQLQNNPTNSATLIATQNTFVNQNGQIDGYVGQLNPLEIQFNKIIQFVQQEVTLKNQFIQQRQLLHNMERAVLQDPTKAAGLQSSYVAGFSTMNDYITQLGSIMSQRDAALANINAVISPALNTSITNILNGAEQFPTSIRIITIDPTSSYNVLQSMDPKAALSDYALLPPIDFTGIAAALAKTTT